MTEDVSLDARAMLTRVASTTEALCSAMKLVQDRMGLPNDWESRAFDMQDIKRQFERMAGGEDVLRSVWMAEARRLRETVAHLEAEVTKWRTKATAYGDIVHGCTPALEAAGYPLAAGSGAPAHSIREAVTSLAEGREQALAACRAAIVCGRQRVDRAQTEFGYNSMEFAEARAVWHEVTGAMQGHLGGALVNTWMREAALSITPPATTPPP